MGDNLQTEQPSAEINSTEVNPTELGPLLILGLTLLVSWTLWATFIYPLMVQHFPGHEARVGVAARTVFWGLPTAIYLARFWGKRALEPLGLSFPLGKNQIARTVLISLVVGICLLVGTSAQSGVEMGELVERLQGGTSGDYSAPVFEELIFRGVVLSELLNWTHDSSEGGMELRLKFWGSQLAAGALFLAIHWPFWWSHFGIQTALQLSLPVFTTGLILGFVFATTRSVWGCIFLHWLNNALSQVT